MENTTIDEYIKEGLNNDLFSFDKSINKEEEIDSKIEEENVLISSNERDVIEKVFNKYNINITDYDNIREVLNKENDNCEYQNIEEILSKQNQLNNLIFEVVSTKNNLFDINKEMKEHIIKLENLQQEIKQIEIDNNEMELEARNTQNLTEDLKKLMDSL
jgi:hypothetical protein